jgi:hypothetical protein
MDILPEVKWYRIKNRRLPFLVHFMIAQHTLQKINKDKQNQITKKVKALYR